jgi:DNA-binding FadR family transcriptional regulator
MALTHIPRTSLVDTVIAQLRAQIMGGQWRRNERIPTEEQLTVLLGVGRNTIREAVRALVHTGMLEVRQGDGTYVISDRDPSAALRQIDSATLRDQLEVRRALEVEAARLAALRRTDADLAAMRQSLDARGSWSDEASLAEFVERDARFHLSVVEASHNAALMELYRYFWSSIQSTIARTEHGHDLPEPTLADHEAIYDAILEGDASAAATAAHRLLSPAIRAIRD